MEPMCLAATLPVARLALLAGLGALFIGVPVWVWYDAQRLNFKWPLAWAVFAMITAGVGALPYLLIRANQPVARPCSSCGRQVLPSYTHCPYCGTAQNPDLEQCPHCRAEVESDWRFCPYCRCRLDFEGPSAAAFVARFCGQCGATLASGAAVCPQCRAACS